MLEGRAVIKMESKSLVLFLLCSSSLLLFFLLINDLFHNFYSIRVLVVLATMVSIVARNMKHPAKKLQVPLRGTAIIQRVHPAALRSRNPTESITYNTYIGLPVCSIIVGLDLPLVL